ncbi:MAG: tetraacyldisaccharide 4'-kinase [Planctomycetota bacterium]
MRRFYLETISGERQGLLAGLTRGVLTLGTGFYVAGHALRRLAYRTGLKRSVRLPVPVVSVGNLTAGGTGKTPMVEYIARWFAGRSLRTVVLARGYGEIPGTGRDDEELFTEMEIGSVVRLTGADRVARARRALDGALRPDVFLLDDGFQHFRIQRDLDLLVVDATDPFAEGRRLPRGLLRESPRAARRADLIIFTRCDQVDRARLFDLYTRLEGLAPGKAFVETRHRPVCVRELKSKTRRDLEWLRDRPVFAFCGIGNPGAFFRTLDEAGARIVRVRAFPDHHRYTADDLRRINAEAQEFMAAAVVTTEKDARKVEPDAFDMPLGALAVEIEVLRGGQKLEAHLRAVVNGRRRVADAAAAP